MEDTQAPPGVEDRGGGPQQFIASTCSSYSNLFPHGQRPQPPLGTLPRSLFHAPFLPRPLSEPSLVAMATLQRVPGGGWGQGAGRCCRLRHFRCRAPTRRAGWGSFGGRWASPGLAGFSLTDGTWGGGRDSVGVRIQHWEGCCWPGARGKRRMSGRKSRGTEGGPGPPAGVADSIPPPCGETRNDQARPPDLAVGRCGPGLAGDKHGSQPR